MTVRAFRFSTTLALLLIGGGIILIHAALTH